MSVKNTPTICPCGTLKKFDVCCGPFLSKEKLPETAEELMRSRYTAFTLADIEYIKKTLAPESHKGFDAPETLKWAQEAKWKKLSILSTKKGTAEDDKGVVEFCAFYEHDGQDLQLHEVSQFRKDKNGQWLFVDGDSHLHPADEDVEHAHQKPATVIRTQEKIGRNDPCTCGSGKKYKKCCAA